MIMIFKFSSALKRVRSKNIQALFFSGGLLVKKLSTKSIEFRPDFLTATSLAMNLKTSW